MIFSVRVMPRASRNLVKKENNGLKVHLTKPAEGGLANKQLIEVLADYFKIKKYRIAILKGHSAREKIIEVSGV